MTTVVTFDIDWAPDWAIALCHELCRSAGVPATFYATHKCDALDDLWADPTVEVGIHPNFLVGSSHGEDTLSVLDYCLRLVPDAASMRTHGLHQSTLTFSAVMDHCPSIIADASLFLPGHPGLQATLLHLGRSRPLVRLPYWWEDDIAACTPGCDWTPPPSNGELRIYDFHPIHVALNMRSLDSYRDLKQQMGKPLWLASERDIAPFANVGSRGTKDFLKDLLAGSDTDGFSRIVDYARSHLETAGGPCA